MSKKKKTKNEKRVDMDLRPYPSPFFQNYDYGSSKNGNKTSPGRSFYADMSEYTSVKDFLNQSRERQYRKRSLTEVTKDILVLAEYFVQLTK